MYPYRGRIHFHVYKKNKITKYVFQIDCVYESATGILCNMEVYSGFGENSGLDLVPRILTPCVHKNSCFHGSQAFITCFVLLALSLGFLLVGTVQSNRKNLPTVFKDTKLKK